LKKEALGFFEPLGATHPMVESHRRRPKHKNNVFYKLNNGKQVSQPMYNTILTPTTCRIFKSFYAQ